MLGFFPRLYEDELLYSWLARYHLYSLNESPKQTMEELFGNRTQLAIPDLPTCLAYLHRQLEHFHPVSLEQWITKHTFYCYHTNFALPETREFVYQTMCNGVHKGAIHVMTGVMASGVRDKERLMYCPYCVEEDFQRYGETYWRLSHQLPSVYVCTKHSCILQESTVSFRPKNRQEFVAATRENCSSNRRNVTYSAKTMEHLHVMAYDSIQLAIEGYEFNWELLQKAYRYLLQYKGIANVKGRVDQHALAQQFQAFYGQEALNLLQSSVDVEDPSCWLKAITRKHRKSFHPVHHLLLIRFLGERIDTILSYASRPYIPFGKSPYPCLNKVCEHYKKDVIRDVHITICTDTRSPVGTFECPACRFTYSRRGPDITGSNRYKIGRIKSFGEVWKHKLYYLISIKKLSYRATAYELGVDTNTVIKYTRKNERVDVLSQKVVQWESDKEKWLELCKTHLEWTVTEIREEHPALYIRLYRNCREWLLANSPKVKARKIVTSRIDWVIRDSEVLQQVKQAVEHLYQVTPPVRLTVSRIGTEIGQRNLLEKKINKIPETKVFLESATESTEQFQIRRVRFFVEQLHDKGELLEWRLKRLAGLRPDISPVVQAEINRLIQQDE